MSSSGGATGFKDTGVEASRLSNLSDVLSFRNAGVFYALVTILLIFTVWVQLIGKNFYLGAANVENILEQAASPVGMMAVGMTVLLISGNFDLSVASNGAFSAMFIAVSVEHDLFGFIGNVEVEVIVILIIAILLACVGGLINGLVHWFVGLNSFIVTLGTLSAFRGMALLISGRQSITFRNTEHGEFMERFIGGDIGEFNLFLLVGGVLIVVAALTFLTGRQMAAGVCAASGLALIVLSFLVDYSTEISHKLVVLVTLVVATWAVMTYTSYGRRVYAVGGNLEAAKAAGINVGLYRVMCFVFLGFCCGLAAVTMISKLQSVEPNLWLTQELFVIASAIIGGVSLLGGAGSVLKTMAGAILLTVLTNGFSFLAFPSEVQLIAVGLLVILSASAYVVAGRRAIAKGKI